MKRVKSDGKTIDHFADYQSIARSYNRLIQIAVFKIIWICPKAKKEKIKYFTLDYSIYSITWYHLISLFVTYFPKVLSYCAWLHIIRKSFKDLLCLFSRCVTNRLLYLQYLNHLIKIC